MKEILVAALFLLGCSSNPESKYPDYDSEGTSQEAEEAEEAAEEQEQDEEATYPEQIDDDQTGCESMGDCEETAPSQPGPEYEDQDSSSD